MYPDDATHDDQRHRREEHQTVVGIVAAVGRIPAFGNDLVAQQRTRTEKLAEESHDHQNQAVTQSVARELKAQYDHLILVCGHYEGIDQRFIDACVDEELSMGDFVLTGGEIPAMAVADAVCRMVPGVLPDAECFEEESHWDGLLEYPQYSRPAVWHDRAVPEILLSGDHAKVAAWRKKESYKRTMIRRPDLFAHFDETKLTTKAERKILAQAKEEFAAEHTETSAEPEE